MEEYIQFKAENEEMDIDLRKIKIFRLTKKDQDISLLSFVSFKIETDNATAKQLSEPGFWPLPCTIGKFINKNIHRNIRPTRPTVTDIRSDFFRKTRPQTPAK